MKKYQKRQRFIATFFLLIFFPTLVPTHLFASNNGPVSPEAASFEPVDAVDMVNLSTGDMSYVLPLLNVPSPEGGYPLALSNHAGIAIDQEASWLGLGWNLNPGAINRGINGVPDDWKRASVNQIVYDDGGESTTYSASISVGWGKGAYSAGIYGAYTENKTFGGSTSYSSDFGAEGSFASATARLGTNGLGIGLRTYGSNLSTSLSVNQSFKGQGTSVSLSRNQPGVGVGISFDSNSRLSSSVSIVGSSLSGNSYSQGALNVRTQSYQISVPIYNVNVGLGFSKARYWTYENNYTKYNGSLYAGDFTDLYNTDLFLNTLSFDSHNSIYRLKSDEQLDNDNLSVVSYDSYSVSGQGMSGTFKPALFQQGSLINNFKDKSLNKSIVSYKNGINNYFTKNVNNTSDDIHFYFENEPSSYLKISTGNWILSTNPSLPISQISPPKPTPIQNGNTNIDGVLFNGYNSSQKRKRTGSFIETFTNKEIITSGSTIIINPENFDRSNKPEDGLGAFRITALDGKTYHYSIPVYQNEQFTRSTDLNKSFDYRFFEQQQLKPYATHWLLTAVTGPDYVDVNQNNKVDEQDYGYWTSFDYGKWSDGFSWSTPIKSNDKSKAYEWGIKEIYYLDKIKTRTHTALFIKEERQDDLSYSLQVGNNENDLSWKNKISRSFMKDKNNSQYYFSGIYNNFLCTALSNTSPSNVVLESEYGQYIKFNKHKSLKLNKILLLKNSDALISKTSLNEPTSNFSGKIKMEQHFKAIYINGATLCEKTDVHHNKSYSGEYFKNVYDVSDITETTEQKAIKTIKFNFKSDDLLAKNSRNSNAPGNGRLTLEGLEFIGRNGMQIIPPYKFEYVNSVVNNQAMEDNWGYYKSRPFEWSLNKIKTPTGSEINISYESDDIDKEAVSGFRGFDSNLQFVYTQVGNKLRVLVQNESLGNAIDFSNHFQVGSTNLDMWTSYRHDYNHWGCKTRKGAVDINENVQVISVSPTDLVLETNITSTFSENGGLDWLFGKVVGLENHPDMIRESFGRGQWGNPPGCINVTDRLVLVYNLLGNKSITTNDKQGGGIRVKEITISDNNIIKNKSNYFYNVPGFGENKTDGNYKSSGITSFVPQKYFKEIKYRSELPSPQVMYEYVTVKNYSSSNEISTIEQYNFEVLKTDTSVITENLKISNILEIEKVQNQGINGLTANSETFNLNYNRFNVNDLTSSIGRLKEKKVYNSALQLLLCENYIFKNLPDIKQGITEESFNTYKRVNPDSGNINYRLGITSVTKYPSMLDRIETTQGGYKNTNFYDKYDFLTGQVLETRTVTSDGKSLKTKIVPAYTKYPQMGSKVDNITNRNMLSQTAAEYSYQRDAAGNDRVTGVGITTWSNIWSYKDIAGATTSPTLDKEKIWRKHKSYTWNGVVDPDGYYPTTFNSTTDDSFVWGVGLPQTNTKWKQTSEVTLYDHYSAPLEMKDINNNFASTKMGDNDTKVMATGNAGYNEMYYSGAENILHNFWLEPEVRLQDGSRESNPAFVHTGKYSVKATAITQFGAYMRNNEHKAGKYKLSVWVHNSSLDKARIRATQSGNPQPFNGERYKAGDWTLLTQTFDVGTIDYYPYVCSADSTPVYYDDLMIRPVASSITGYVYNEWDELTHIIGNNGLATKFVYDDAGRLIKTYTEVIDDTPNNLVGGFKLTQQNKINYKHLK
jgi:hypothetical protein